ncbi:hypothetical protein [Nitrosospira briensis]|uniref:hypothetical protein n=1 Tax=Nitrosospira briensis TaxID=35799 RepID=UPI0008F358B7|nr:hypothetical protein [Nitrosospira briensis]SFN98745.1 hypothetical protein SAMN05216332_10389 [Nitrosospira briensis]
MIGKIICGLRGLRSNLAAVVAILMCSTLCMSSAIAEDEARKDLIELPITRPPVNGEAVWVQIRAGVLPHGAEIRVSTPDGVLLGTVSSFPALRGQEAAVTHTIPLPQNIITRRHVRLRLEVEAPGKRARAPQPREIESINLIYVPVSD